MRTSSTETDSLCVRLEFTQDELIVAQTEVEAFLQLLRGGVIRGTPGSPALPFRKCFVSVPADAAGLSVAWTDGPCITIERELKAAPVQPVVPTWETSGVRRVPPDPKFYASDAVCPSVPCVLAGTLRMGGLAAAELDVCPLRYHPRSGLLELVRSIEVRLTYRSSSEARKAAPSLSLLRFERRASERISRLVENPADVARFLQFDHATLPGMLQTYPTVKHVIVTRAELAPEFLPLTTWRSDLGIPSRIVTVEEIVAGTVADTGGAKFWLRGVYADGNTRDRAEAIRNFVKWATVHWETEYLVLGGDTHLVPTQYGLATDCSIVAYDDLAAPEKDVEHHPPFRCQVTASTSLPGTDAANVLDGDATTVWAPATGDAAPTLTFDLAPHSAVNTLDITWGAAYSPAYAIEVSADGVSWPVVLQTSTGAGGTEQCSWTASSVSHVRLRIHGGTPFQIVDCSLHAPRCGRDAAIAYRIDATTTRLFLSRSMRPNPANATSGDMILVKDGTKKGLFIPYAPSAPPSSPSWRFVTDLTGVTSDSAAPTPYIEIRGPSDWHGQPFILKSEINYIPTDLYFADVSPTEYPVRPQHDWDADGNGVYGELYGNGLDRVNGVADAYVGRLPANNRLEVQTLVRKILCYERYRRPESPARGGSSPLSASFATTAVLGSTDWDPINTPGALDPSAQGKEQLRHFFQKSPSGKRFRFRRRYQDFLDVPAADVNADLGVADSASVKAAIQEGANIVSLTAHGSPAGACYMYSADVDSLTNDPGIWYGNSCSTNKFDDTGSECMGEHVLLNPYGGGVAYVGNTRWGWTSDNPVEYAFWTEAFHSGRLGPMLERAHLFAGSWGKYALNLLGDPAMPVWVQAGQDAIVDYPAKAFAGESLVVHVGSSSAWSIRGGHCLLDVTGCHDRHRLDRLIRQCLINRQYEPPGDDAGGRNGCRPGAVVREPFRDHPHRGRMASAGPDCQGKRARREFRPHSLCLRPPGKTARGMDRE